MSTYSRILHEGFAAAQNDISVEIRDIWNVDYDSYSAHTALIIALLQLLCVLTEIVVQAAGAGEMPLSAHRIREVWQTMARKVNQLESDRGVVFYRGLIEAGYVISVVIESSDSQQASHSSPEVSNWATIIHRAHEHSPEAVEKAFKQIYPSTGGRRQRTATLPKPMLRLSEFKPIREHEDADRILEQFDPTTQSPRQQRRGDPR